MEKTDGYNPNVPSHIGNGLGLPDEYLAEGEEVEKR
jgi:hypothetical protein